MAGLAAIYFARSLKKFVLFFLVTKPLFDLTWRWDLGSFAGQRINIQSLVGVYVIAVTALAILFWRKKLVFDIRIILLITFATLSVLLTPTYQGINEWLRLISGLSFYFVAGVILSEEKSFDRFTKYFLLVVSVPVILSFMQRFGLLSFEYWDWVNGQPIGRVSGTYQHPLGLVYFLIFAIPLGLYLFEKRSQFFITRLLAGIFIAISMIALVLTYHRTALVAVGLEIWLWLILNKRYLWTVFIMVIGILIFLWLGDWIQGLYANLIEIVQGKVAFSSADFLRGRGVNWYLFLNSTFSSHPIFWLFGRGGSIAEGYVPELGFWSSDEPHNDYIRILHAYGLIGLGLYLAVIISFFLKGIRLRNRKDDFSRKLGNLMIVILASLILLSVTTEPMRYPTGVWYLFGLGSIAKVRLRRKIIGK
jgi:O-antigen ligase